MKHTIISMMAVICILAVGVPRARATLITIEIEAVVDSVDDQGNYLEGKINVGDIITGTYTYESTTPDSQPSSNRGDYWHYDPPAGISLTVGGFNFTTDPCNISFLVGISNDNPSGDDVYWIESYNNLSLSNGTPVDYIFWSLKDHTATALSSDALPTTPPVWNDWQENVLRLEGDRKYFIDAHVTSAIPEPATILLLGLGGLFLRRQS